MSNHKNKGEDKHNYGVCVIDIGSPRLGNIGWSLIDGQTEKEWSGDQLDQLFPLIPEILDKTVIDRMLEIDVIEAYEVSKVLARQGIFVGQSCGAYLLGAKTLAEELKTGHIVTVFNDIGERYFSTSMWD